MMATRSEYRDALRDLEKAINFSERSGSNVVTFDTRMIRLIFEVHTKKAFISECSPGGVFAR